MGFSLRNCPSNPPRFSKAENQMMAKVRDRIDSICLSSKISVEGWLFAGISIENAVRNHPKINIEKFLSAIRNPNAWGICLHPGYRIDHTDINTCFIGKGRNFAAQDVYHEIAHAFNILPRDNPGEKIANMTYLLLNEFQAEYQSLLWASMDWTDSSHSIFQRLILYPSNFYGGDFDEYESRLRNTSEYFSYFYSLFRFLPYLSALRNGRINWENGFEKQWQRAIYYTDQRNGPPFFWCDKIKAIADILLSWTFGSEMIQLVEPIKEIITPIFSSKK